MPSVPLFQLKVFVAPLPGVMERASSVEPELRFSTPAAWPDRVRPDSAIAVLVAAHVRAIGPQVDRVITRLEQPLQRGDLKSLAELRHAVSVPIAAQESVSSADDALAVLEERAADLLKIKLTHIGGFERAREVAAVVGAKGLPVVIGQGSACTTILSAAEMHLHCALKNAQPGGEMTGFLRLGEQDIFGTIPVSRGKAFPPMSAGHGIAVNKQSCSV